MTRSNPAPVQSPSRRPARAFALFLLAPLVGEFLLGNLPITWLGVLVTLAPLYGGGALVIREWARRRGRGWPTMILLGLAYALVEEAFVTQSLFNPEYVGLRLLDFGYIPRLGIGAWWTVFVLGIHTIWSTAVPIALIESWSGDTAAARQPWFGRWGLGVAVMVFVLGCAATAALQPANPVRVSPMQFAVSGALVAALAVVAFRLPRPVAADQSARHPDAPRSWLVGLTTFVLGSAFMLVARLGDALPAALSVGAMLAVLVAAAWFLALAAGLAGWSAMHRFSAAAGFLLVYVWYGFVQVPSVGAPSAAVNIVGDVVFSAGAIVLLVVTVRRCRRGPGESVA